jgi:ketosteroid isomerase-like protein
MSQENVKLVREVYDGWARGDFNTGDFGPGFEWGQLSGAVEPGVRRGAEVGDALRRLFEVYEGFRVEPEEFIDAAEHVVVVGRARGTGRQSGIELDQRFAFVWTIRDETLCGFQLYQRRDEALEAVGLAG